MPRSKAKVSWVMVAAPLSPTLLYFTFKSTVVEEWSISGSDKSSVVTRRQCQGSKCFLKTKSYENVQAHDTDSAPLGGSIVAKQIRDAFFLPLYLKPPEKFQTQWLSHYWPPKILKPNKAFATERVVSNSIFVRSGSITKHRHHSQLYPVVALRQ